MFSPFILHAGKPLDNTVDSSLRNYKSWSKHLWAFARGNEKGPLFYLCLSSYTSHLQTKPEDEQKWHLIPQKISQWGMSLRLLAIRKTKSAAIINEKPLLERDKKPQKAHHQRTLITTQWFVRRITSDKIIMHSISFFGCLSPFKKQTSSFKAP